MRKEKVLVSGVVKNTKTVDIRFEQSELIVRFIEVLLEAERPAGKTAVEAIELIKATVEDGDELVSTASEMATVAFEYFAEQINNSGHVEMGRVPETGELQ